MLNRLKRLLPVLLCLAAPTFVRAQLSFYTNSGSITITGYNPAGGPNLIIPSTTNGFPVTVIGQNAFQFLNLTNVLIPNSITMISNYAFYGCQRLTNVMLPASLAGVGRIMFNYCTNLQDISVNNANPAFSSAGGVLFNKAQTTLLQCPNGLQGSYVVPGTVTSLSWGAFSGTRLSNVSLPASVTNMENYVFDYCASLTNFSAAAANPSFMSTNGVLFTKDQTTLMAFPGAIAGVYVVPNTVTNIAGAAFDYSVLSQVILPNSLKNISLLAFGSCPNLASIIIPASVTNVMVGAFDSSYTLARVYFLGHAPATDWGDQRNTPIFSSATTVFYLPGTTNWGDKYGTAPTVLWNPQMTNLNFGKGEFSSDITMPSNSIIVIEACTNLAQPAWMPLVTNVYSGTSQISFSDPQSAIYPQRFYRLRTP